MTRQVLFVQGGGKAVHDEWDNRLVDSLRRQLGPGYAIRYPRMPDEADPSYVRWSAAIRAELTKLEDGAVLVGHSVGGTILINALAEDPPRLTLGGIFLIAAPFAGEGGWPSDDIEHPGETLGARLAGDVPLYLYHGSDDAIAPVAHLELYARAIPQAVIRRLSGRDHQLNDDLSEVARDIMQLT